MSVSLRFWAKGDIWGSFRRPSRNLISCQWVKKTGCAASDGVPGIVAFPSAPWQAPHGSAFRRPASRSAASAGPATTRATARPATMATMLSRRARLCGRFAIASTAPTERSAFRAPALPAQRFPVGGGSEGGRSPPPSSPLVGDPVDRPRIVVRHEERAVLHLLRVDRAAPDLVALEPPLREDLVLGRGTGPERDHHHPEADLLRPVPGAALGEKGAVLVLGREHRARVEVDAVSGHVRPRLEERRYELRARAPLAELWVEDIALVAVRVAEVQALLRCDVEAVARHVVAQPVAAVGGEVELLGHRVPVEAHAVADAAGDVLEAGAVGIDAGDVGMSVRRHADVAGRADVEVELAVRPEGQVLPPVRQVAGQDVVDDLH